jgi:hypothetical protein
MLAAPVVGQTRAGKLGVGVDGSMQYLLGAGSTNSSPGFGGGVSLSYSVMEYFSIRSKFCINQLGWKTSTRIAVSNPPNKSVITDMMALNLYLSGDLMPNSNFNVFPFIGAGFVSFDPKNDNGRKANVSSSDIQYSFGAGAEYFLNEFWSVTLMGEYVLTNSAYYAGSSVGNNLNNDSFMRGSLQVRYYFFDQSFIKKLLDAQRDRSKRK